MIRLPLEAPNEGHRLLPAPAARYVARVLRAKIGDAVEVFDPRTGAVASATVTALDREAVALSIGPISRGLHAARAIVLVQGYPKGDKLGDIARDATELGATAIVPAICARSIARPEPMKSSTKLARLDAIVREAARQAGRTRAPDVLAPMPWIDALAMARAQTSVAFVFWEQAKVSANEEIVEACRSNTSIAIAIGPEGGLDEDEIAIAEKAGFLVRSLGPTILRTETAATAVLGAIALLSTT